MSHEEHTHADGRMTSADWDRRYGEKPLYWGAEPNRFVAAETVELPAGRALDLACGEGRNAVWLAERGWDVTAIDFSPIAIERARTLAADRGVAVRLRVDDVVKCPLGECAFDLVLVAYLQLPREEWSRVLERVGPAVAPGGTILLVGHDIRNLSDGTGGPTRAAVLWHAHEIAQALEDAGLEIERAGEVLRDVVGTDRPAIDTLVRARRPVAGSRGPERATVETGRMPSLHRAGGAGSPDR